VLEICGEGTVELHDGLLIERAAPVPGPAGVGPGLGFGSGSGSGSGLDGPNVGGGVPGVGPGLPHLGSADEDQDRAVAAQWLHVHAGLVRVVHSEHSLCWPAVRIPELTDLTGSRPV
jgi:hypothetical protein